MGHILNLRLSNLDQPIASVTVYSGNGNDPSDMQGICMHLVFKSSRCRRHFETPTFVLVISLAAAY